MYIPHNGCPEHAEQLENIKSAVKLSQNLLDHGFLAAEQSALYATV